MQRLILIYVCGRTFAAREVARGAFDAKYKKFVLKKYERYYRIGTLYPFEDGFPHLQEFLDDAEKLDIDCRITTDVYFTPAEIRKLPFYQMLLRVPFELQGTTPEEYGTQYTEEHCSHCKYGGKLKGDLLVDRKFMRNCKIGSFYSHNFVKEEIIPILESNGLTGLSYTGNVRDYKGREMPSFKLFEPNHILPPYSKTTCLKKSSFPCQYCGYTMTYFYGPPEYERKKLEGALDFNWSYEICNNYMERELIVSAKVKEVFKANKIFAYFRPIVILD